MNPDMMKLAMESMAKLTPTQMAEMQRQMASMPPSFLQQQMEAMKGMSPQVLQQQLDAAKQLDPAAMERQMNSAAAMARQQEEYKVRASNLLKEEGNRLFSAGKTTEATEKYERAKSNLSGYTSQNAAAVRMKCMLNLASCHLRLNKYDACISECSQVLQTDPDNMKALYRRGQAHLAVQNNVAAVSDLRRALGRAPDQEKPLIQEKLKEAEGRLDTCEEVAVDGCDSPVETVSSAEPSVAASAGPSQSPGPGLPMDPDQMRQALRMMRDNSGMLEQMRAAVTNMTPEQLQAGAQACEGMPHGVPLSPEAMRAAMDTFSTLDPKDLEDMVSTMQGSAGVSSSSNASDTATLNPQLDQFRQAATALQANPEMMTQAMDMFSKMDPEQLAAMSASMGAVGEGGQPSAAAMSKMLGDPQSVKMVKDVISNLTPQQLAAMSEASGKQLTPEQAEAMSRQINNLSDKQLELLLKGASWLNRGASLAQQARDTMLKNKVLVLGIFLLLIALILRHCNIL